MSLAIHTAHYRYAGPDRVDITVKGKDPEWKVFAPTWKMVMAVKNKGAEAHQYYLDEYYKILANVPLDSWNELLNKKRIVLVCFCRQEEFCHRNILANYIINRVHSAFFAGFIE